MNITRIIAIALIAATVGAGGVQAQISDRLPAEFPPASYKGKQYVDSTGCVFIRAGIDGNVTWVPRVNRSRKTVCGFRPTNVAGVATAPQPAQTAQRITVNTAPPAQAIAAPCQPSTPPSAPDSSRADRRSLRPDPDAAPSPPRTVPQFPSACG